MERIRNIMLIPLLLVFLGCSSPSKLLETTKSDSLRIETRYIKYTEKDTVYFEIPAQAAERVTKDSVSHLENDYAISDARVNADGTLSHELRTKPQAKPVPAEKTVERRDSIVYVDKKVEVPVFLEKDLSHWQKIKMNLGGFAVALTVIAILLSIKRFFGK